MLAGLSIRNVVLIERLSLTFESGLCALTGETGAGKSILLDALGLALGARGDSGLLRRGADGASVTAEFAVAADHPAVDLLNEHDVEPDDRLVLRRTLGSDGRSRAQINDQPVSIGLLRRVGEALVEIHGQFDTQGLLDPQNHRQLLDQYGGFDAEVRRTADAWAAWRRIEADRADAQRAADEARAEEDFLRHALAELDALDPNPGEEAALADKRQMLMHREKLVEAVTGALDHLSGEHGTDRSLGAAARQLQRVVDHAGGRLDPVLDAIDRAAGDLADAAATLESFGSELDLDPGELERLEERLFALRALARKHGVTVDELAGRRDELADRLGLIEGQGDTLTRLAKQAAAARTEFENVASMLSQKRRDVASRLDKAVARELAPLRLDKARFVTEIAPLDEDGWGAAGCDRVRFAVATNPGAPPGPIHKVASGGELARFMLALKVVLARTGSAPTLVFDEVDSGISGAVADAVGERLALLGRDLQVLVVTHSPQVAARASHHLRVQKDQVMEQVLTTVVPLPDAARREEIARMLSGARITDQARAAADSLIAARRP